MISKRQREFVEHLLVSDDTGMSDTEWAELMGVPYRTVQSWKPASDPSKDSRTQAEVRAVFEAAKKEYDDTTSVLGKKTFVWAVEEAIVNYKAAKKAKDSNNARQWWKVLSDLTESKQTGPRIDYAMWSDSDLEAEVYLRGLSDEVSAIERARGIA